MIPDLIQTWIFRHTIFIITQAWHLLLLSTESQRHPVRVSPSPITAAYMFRRNRENPIHLRPTNTTKILGVRASVGGLWPLIKGGGFPQDVLEIPLSSCSKRSRQVNLLSRPLRYVPVYQRLLSKVARKTFACNCQTIEQNRTAYLSSDWAKLIIWMFACFWSLSIFLHKNKKCSIYLHNNKIKVIIICLQFTFLRMGRVNCYILTK